MLPSSGKEPFARLVVGKAPAVPPEAQDDIGSISIETDGVLIRVPGDIAYPDLVTSSVCCASHDTYGKKPSGRRGHKARRFSQGP